MSASVVVMSATHSKEEIQLSQERRDGIVNFLLEWLTGDQIDSKTLGHFRFVGEMFGLAAKVREIVGKTSSVQGRQELCVSLAVAALNLAVSDEPVRPTDRQLERREARAAAKQFEAAVAGKSEADAEPVKPLKARGIYGKPRASLSSKELEHVRKMANARQARWKAKRKALAVRSRQGKRF
jgi:hypothetical protein